MIIRSDDPRVRDLAESGWQLTARSWAAALGDVNGPLLRALVARAETAGFVLRAITSDDVDQVVALDRATLGDYPGGPASAHIPLTPSTATVCAHRRGFGAFDPEGRLVATTYLDLGEVSAETDFTVVARNHRGQHLSEAVKASAVLELSDHGIRVFRTGGSAENLAIIAANAALGYVQDEEWFTYAPPDGAHLA